MNNELVPVEKVAKEIDGRQYRENFSKEILEYCKANHLIIITGCSDDLVEFDGFSCEEFGYTGPRDENFVVSDEKLHDIEENMSFQLKEATLANKMKLKAFFWEKKAVVNNKEVEAAWVFEVTGIPFAQFRIFEEGEKELQCVGLVVDVSSLIEA